MRLLCACSYTVLALTLCLLSHCACSHTVLALTLCLLSHCACSYTVLALTLCLLLHCACSYTVLALTLCLLLHCACSYTVLALTLCLLLHCACSYTVLALTLPHTGALERAEWALVAATGRSLVEQPFVSKTAMRTQASRQQTEEVEAAAVGSQEGTQFNTSDSSTFTACVRSGEAAPSQALTAEEPDVDANDLPESCADATPALIEAAPPTTAESAAEEAAEPVAEKASESKAQAVELVEKVVESKELPGAGTAALLVFAEELRNGSCTEEASRLEM